MNKKSSQTLSFEGENFLRDSVMHAALVEICTPLDVTPKEFLIRFEEVLSTNPDKIFGILENK